MRRILFIILLSGSYWLIAQNNSGQRKYVDAYGKYYSGKWNEAVNAFSDIIQNERTPDLRFILYRGIAEWKSGNLISAESDFNSACDKNVSEAFLWMARIKAVQNDQPSAIANLKEYLKHAPDADQESLHKDTSFISLHASDAWFDLWQQEWDTKEKSILDEAGYFAGKKDFVRAHTIIEEKTGQGLADEKLHAYNAGIYSDEGNYALALDEMNKSINLQPYNSTWLKSRAGIYLELNKFKEAITDLDQVIDNDAGDFNARYLRASVYYKAGDYEHAKEDIETCIRYLDSYEMIFLAGQVESAQGDYIDALKHFNRLMDQGKPSASLYRARGLTYYESNNMTPASYDLSMSLDLDPENPEANYYLGLAEYNNGDMKLACYYWQRAKNFGSTRAIEYLAKYCYNRSDNK